MKRAAFAFMLVALVSAGCEGQSNNGQLASKDVSQELARLRFDAKNFDSLIEQATGEAFAAAYPELRARFHRELSPSEVNMFQNVIRRIFLEVYPRVLWEEKISTVYSKHFTAQELQEIVRFYGSPVGLKLRKVESTLAAEEVAATRQMIRERLDRVGRRFSEELRKVPGDHR